MTPVADRKAASDAGVALLVAAGLVLAFAADL